MFSLTIFQSRNCTADTPGSIPAGGELGYALSVAFGAVMDKPNFVCVCMIGDGEAESGPTATTWRDYEYIDLAESGAVLQIVHVNGFKISERAMCGTMDEKLVPLSSPYEYNVHFVEDLEHIDEDMAASMEWAQAKIQKIQKAAQSGNPIGKLQWPVLILEYQEIAPSTSTADKTIFSSRSLTPRLNAVSKETANIYCDHL